MNERILWDIDTLLGNDEKTAKQRPLLGNRLVNKEKYTSRW
jgi:hypothetical protein